MIDDEPFLTELPIRDCEACRDGHLLSPSSASLGGAAAIHRSVDEFPTVRSIELSYLNTLLKPRIKVVQIDTVLAARLGKKRLPMRGTSAGLATHIAQSPVAPDVLGRILRVSFYPNRSELVVRPKSTKAAADRAIAPGRFLRR